MGGYLWGQPIFRDRRAPAPPQRHEGHDVPARDLARGRERRETDLRPLEVEQHADRLPAGGRVLDLGVELKCNTVIGKDVLLEDLQRDVGTPGREPPT